MLAGGSLRLYWWRDAGREGERLSWKNRSDPYQPSGMLKLRRPTGIMMLFSAAGLDAVLRAPRRPCLAGYWRAIPGREKKTMGSGGLHTRSGA